MKNLAGMMKQAQEMQSRMEALQQEMADTEFSAAVGGGAVQVTVTGCVMTTPSAKSRSIPGMSNEAPARSTFSQPSVSSQTTVWALSCRMEQLSFMA